MDPAIENIILGVIANGATSLLTYLGNFGWKVLIGEELLQEIDRQKTALDPILQKAIEVVSEELDWENPAWFILDLFGAKKSLTLSTVLDDFARWKSATRTAFQGQIKRFLLIVGPKRASRSAEFVKEFFPPE